MLRAPVHVVAGALSDPAGRILIAERPAGKAHAGRWEFPGGKVRAGESPRDGLARELAEELGIELLRCAPLLAATHRYPDAPAPILIDCWRVDLWRGVPEPLDGQRLRWCTLAELAAADILEADRAIVTALVLPGVFMRLTAGTKARRGGAGSRRVAWLAAADPDADGLLAELTGGGDAGFLIDPPVPPAGMHGALYTAPSRVVPATSRAAPAGCIVASAAEAEAARAAGGDFLLVVERRLPAAELAAIAAVGLPWYLNVVEPGSRDAPAPTGRLWWRTSARPGVE